MIKQIKGRRVVVAMASIAVLVLFAACDGAGAGGGGGGGGSATITFMASGTYTDTDDGDFSIVYVVGGRGEVVVYEDEITLPWTTDVNVDAEFPVVSINITALTDHSNSMTLSIYENGNLVAEHSMISEDVLGGDVQPPGSLTHVVGQ